MPSPTLTTVDPSTIPTLTGRFAPVRTECVIRRKTDTSSGAKRTAFRSYPDKVPAESGQLI
jgi:hypothetical protein